MAKNGKNRKIAHFFGNYGPWGWFWYGHRPDWSGGHFLAGFWSWRPARPFGQRARKRVFFVFFEKIGPTWSETGPIVDNQASNGLPGSQELENCWVGQVSSSFGGSEGPKTEIKQTDSNDQKISENRKISKNRFFLKVQIWLLEVPTDPQRGCGHPSGPPEAILYSINLICNLIDLFLFIDLDNLHHQLVCLKKYNF